MSTLQTFSPLPILRLLAAPRAFLVLIGGASWTLGTAWIATMVRFESSQFASEQEAGLFGSLIGAVTLFGVAALIGVVLGEAAQELFRRPMMSRLPGMTRRVARGSMCIGLASSSLLCATVQLLWAPQEWQLSAADATLLPCPLATFSIALLGFSAGAWLLVRVGYGWGWILRFLGFFALAYAAQPLLLAGTLHVSWALALIAMSAYAMTQRFRPALVSKMAAGSVPTIFGGIDGWGKSTNRALLQKTAKSELLPPRELGRDLSGWCAARDYEQLTARNGFSATRLFLLLGALPILIVLAGPFASALLRGFPDNGLWDLLAGSLLGATENQPIAGAEWFKDQAVRARLFVLLGLTTALLAVLASVPLSSALFYPLSRRLHARLAFRTALVIGVAHAVVTLVLGLGLGAALLALGGGSWPQGIPAIVLVELVLLVLFPLLVFAGLHLRRAFAAGKLFRGVLIAVVPAILALVLFPTHVLPGISALFERQPTLALLGYAASVTASFMLLRFLFDHHYRRADLA